MQGQHSIDAAALQEVLPGPDSDQKSSKPLKKKSKAKGRKSSTSTNMSIRDAHSKSYGNSGGNTTTTVNPVDQRNVHSAGISDVHVKDVGCMDPSPIQTDSDLTLPSNDLSESSCISKQDEVIPDNGVKNSAMISSPISIPVLEQDEVAADGGVEGSIMDPSPVSKPALVDENDNEDENEEEFEDVTEINIDHFNDDSGEWVPKLMQSEDPNHRAFVDKNGELHYIVMDHDLDSSVTDVPYAVLYAYQISLLLGCKNRKSMRNLLLQHRELPFTINDWDVAIKRFGRVMNCFHIRKKRSTLPNPNTYKPGELLFIDPKQCGPRSMQVMNAVDHATGYGVAVAFDGTSATAYQNAIVEVLRRFKQVMVRSKVKGVGVTRQIYCDADTKIDEIVRNYLLKEYHVHIGPAPANYSCTKIEAAIKQTDIRLSKVVESWPVPIPDYLNREFWIAIAEMNNYMVHYPNKTSPMHKFLGYRPDLNKLNWLPVGQLVAYRREDKARKKRSKVLPGEVRNDSILGKARMQFGFLGGTDRYNIHTRVVYPISSDDFTAAQLSRRARVKNPQPVPMHIDFFPTSLVTQEKSYKPVYRHLLRFSHAVSNLPRPPIHPHAPEDEYIHGSSVSSVSNLVNESETTFPYDESYDELGVDDDVYGGTTSLLTITGVTADSPSDIIQSEYNMIDNLSRSDHTIALMSSAFVTVMNTIIDYGEEWALEIPDKNAWSSVREQEDAINHGELEIQAVRNEIMESCNDKMQTNCIKIIEEELAANNELNEDIVTALYASPPMSAKAAMKQKCPLLVQAALAAIEKEKKNLIDNKVMKFLPYKDIPEEYRNKIISTFVFIVNKMKTDGSFNEAKCRVVCNGSQEKDNMYTRTASPVVNKCLLYLMFQLMTEPGWEVYTMDVSAAFLKVSVPSHRHIYVRVDESLRDGTKATTNARLMKYLYGLTASSYNFYVSIKEVLLKNGFQCTQFDGGLFYKHEKVNGVLTSTAVIALHVDDILMMTMDVRTKDVLFEKMTERYENVKCEKCTSYLGLSVVREDGKVTISIPGYLKTMGDHLNVQDEIDKYKNKRWDYEVPWDGQAQRVKLGQDERKVDIRKYQQLLGLLNYACNVRYECTVYVNMLANPTTSKGNTICQ